MIDKNKSKVHQIHKIASVLIDVMPQTPWERKMEIAKSVIERANEEGKKDTERMNRLAGLNELETNCVISKEVAYALRPFCQKEGYPSKKDIRLLMHHLKESMNTPNEGDNNAL